MKPKKVGILNLIKNDEKLRRFCILTSNNEIRFHSNEKVIKKWKYKKRKYK